MREECSAVVAVAAAAVVAVVVVWGRQWRCNSCSVERAQHSSSRVGVQPNPPPLHYKYWYSVLHLIPPTLIAKWVYHMFIWCIYVVYRLFWYTDGISSPTPKAQSGRWIGFRMPISVRGRTFLDKVLNHHHHHSVSRRYNNNNF